MQSLWIDQVGFTYPNKHKSENFLAELGLDEHGKQIFKQVEWHALPV